MCRPALVDVICRIETFFERDFCLCKEGEYFRIVGPIFLILSRVLIFFLGISEFARKMRQDIERSFTFSSKEHDLFINFSSNIVSFLYDKDICKFFQYFSIIWKIFGKVFIDKLSLFKLSISLIDFCEDEIEIAMILL